MKCSIAVAFFFLAILPTSSALPHYANRIPNGFSVPNPGPQGGVWAGVGHVNAGGGGERNAFGEDFATAGHVWTAELCQTDSDGDGRSNGEELGDPDCIWVEGNEAAGPALSHPGIVDEVKEESDGLVDYCDVYEEPENVSTLDVVFSQPNIVDGNQTHYICEQRELDLGDIPPQPHHLIKTSVLLDNPELLHHMFIFICEEGEEPSDGNKIGQGSYECLGQQELRCARVAGWAVGPDDFCEPPNVGIEIDLTGRSKVHVKIEAHYDNALGIVGAQDQSGMSLTLTPDLRPLKGGGTFLGMQALDNDFVLPPNTQDTRLSNICPADATRQLTHPVYVYNFFPHMHLFGYELYTEHWRCGKKIGEIGRIDTYEFDNQQSYGLVKPIKILPGDALVTHCHYNTVGQNETILGGEETTDEMCLNILGYYPHAGTEDSPNLFDACISFLNGITMMEQEIPPVAIVGSDIVENPEQQGNLLEGLILNFDADPAATWSDCCDTNTCEEYYLAQEGEACGVDDDCKGDALFCNGGLCDERLAENIESNENDGSGAGRLACTTRDFALLLAALLM